MVEDISLKAEIVEGSRVYYKQLHFEGYLLSALATFHIRGKNLGNPEPELEDSELKSVTRLSDKDMNGICCRYTRLPSGIHAPLSLKDWNNYNKIEELVEFYYNDDYVVGLKKYKYFLTFQCTEEESVLAEQAANDAFDSFKDSVVSSDTSFKDRKVDIASIPTKNQLMHMVITFGSEDYKLALNLEFILQRTFLHNFLKKKGEASQYPSPSDGNHHTYPQENT